MFSLVCTHPCDVPDKRLSLNLFSDWCPSAVTAVQHNIINRPCQSQAYSNILGGQSGPRYMASGPSVWVRARDAQSILANKFDSSMSPQSSVKLSTMKSVNLTFCLLLSESYTLNNCTLLEHILFVILKWNQSKLPISFWNLKERFCIWLRMM